MQKSLISTASRWFTKSSCISAWLPVWWLITNAEMQPDGHAVCAWNMKHNNSVRLNDMWRNGEVNQKGRVNKSQLKFLPKTWPVLKQTLSSTCMNLTENRARICDARNGWENWSLSKELKHCRPKPSHENTGAHEQQENQSTEQH
jgi:hypothetical protein